MGVQMATDIKELYPNKSVTLVHSRKVVMNKFHHGLHDIIEDRCLELGIDMRLGSRVKIPPKGYPTDGSQFDVELEDGSKIPADFAVRLFFQRKLPPCADAMLLDHLHWTDTTVKCSPIFCTGDYRQHWIHSHVEDFADLRNTPSFICRWRCRSNGCTQSCQTVSRSVSDLDCNANAQPEVRNKLNWLSRTSNMFSMESHSRSMTPQNQQPFI